jgi:hypothetical protein
VHKRFEPETLCSFDLLAAESRRLSPSQAVGRLGRNGNKHAVATGVVSASLPFQVAQNSKRIMGLAKRNQKGRLLTGPSITPAHSAAAVYLRSEEVATCFRAALAFHEALTATEIEVPAGVR